MEHWNIVQRINIVTRRNSNNQITINNLSKQNNLNSLTKIWFYLQVDLKKDNQEIQDWPVLFRTGIKLDGMTKDL